MMIRTTFAALALTLAASACPPIPGQPSGMFWWMIPPPDVVPVDAEAIQSPSGNYWAIKEVLHGPAAILTPVLGGQSRLLAIAIPYQGNFFVYTKDPHTGGFTLPSPSTVGIFYLEDPCDQYGDMPIITMPLAGPIPASCPIDAWIYVTPRGQSMAEAAQVIADSYAATP